MREAISLAINRTKLSVIGETGYEGVATPSACRFPITNIGSNPSLPGSDLQFPAVNDAKAEQLLQAAGFRKDANGIYAKDGKELSFSLEVVSGLERLGRGLPPHPAGSRENWHQGEYQSR